MATGRFALQCGCFALQCGRFALQCGRFALQRGRFALQLGIWSTGRFAGNLAARISALQVIVLQSGHNLKQHEAQSARAE